MKEREPIWIFVGFQGRFVHQTANGKVGHHESIELLFDEVRSFASQHNLGAAQMRFQFI